MHNTKDRSPIQRRGRRRHLSKGRRFGLCSKAGECRGNTIFPVAAGMQELASVLTSCLNLLQHLRGLYSVESAVSHVEVRSRCPSPPPAAHPVRDTAVPATAHCVPPSSSTLEARLKRLSGPCGCELPQRPNLDVHKRLQSHYPYRIVWLLFAVVNCGAWLASMVFHARDTYVTERCDYAAAFTVVIASCAAAVVRIAPARCDRALRTTRALPQHQICCWRRPGGCRGRPRKRAC